MFFGKPDRRGGGGGGQHGLNAMFAHHIHDAFQPVEVEFTFLGFAQAPGEFADAHHIDAGLDHELGIDLPLRFGIFGSAGERKDPLLRIIINAEIHRLYSGSEFILTLDSIHPGGN